MTAISGRARPAGPTAEVESSMQSDWTPVWFALVENSWSSLAIVPAHPHQSTRRIAHMLAEVAHAYDGEELEVIEAEHVLPAGVRAVAQRLTEVAESGRRALLAVCSPIANYSAIPLVRKTDAAIMIVPLEIGRLADIRRTANLIGRSRFLGSVTMATPLDSSASHALPPAVGAET